MPSTAETDERALAVATLRRVADLLEAGQFPGPVVPPADAFPAPGGVSGLRSRLIAGVRALRAGAAPLSPGGRVRLALAFGLGLLALAGHVQSCSHRTGDDGKPAVGQP